MLETQSLLPGRFRTRAMRVWITATVITVAFLLGVIFASLLGALSDNAITRAKSDVTQFFRRSASEQALTEPAARPWPWGEIVMPAEGATVPRLGLSAAVLRAGVAAENHPSVARSGSRHPQS